MLVNLPLTRGHAPVANTLFVDWSDVDKTSAIQNSLRDLFGFYPLKVLHTSIQHREVGKSEEVMIPGLFVYKVSFEHRLPMSPEVSDNLYPWLSNAKQGMVKSVVYSPKAEIPVKYSKTNAISAEFRIAVPRQ